jgi:hypothetical protein
MDLLWILLPIGVVGGILAWHFFIRIPGKKKAATERMTKNLGIDGVPANWLNSELTPLGARVVWNDNPFNNEEEKALAFACFDVGLRNATNAMSPKYPTWDFNNSLVTIGILPATATNLDGSNALMTKAGQQIAGAVIGVDDGYALQMILIPSQKENGWRYTDLQARTIWYESEHLREGMSNIQEFIRYSGRVEGIPDNHPHHPLPAGVEEIPAPSAPNAIRSFVSVKSNPKCGGV